MAILTPIPVFLFNGTIFVAINLIWVCIAELFVRLWFELHITRQLLQGRVLRIYESPFGPLTIHAYTDGSPKMKTIVGMLFLLMLTASLTLEFGFDAGTYFTYVAKLTSVLAVNQSSAAFSLLRERGYLLESTGYYIANMNSCLEALKGHLEQYESNSSALPLTRRYSGDFKVYFPVTRQRTGQPFCSNQGVEVKGTVVMFVGISSNRSQGLSVQREENINPQLVNLERAILDTLELRRSVTASNATFVDASRTVRTIFIAPGIICKTGNKQRQLCFIKLKEPYTFRKDNFTHALVQQHTTDSNKWFAHALVRQPESARPFVDYGWYKRYAPRVTYDVEQMPMALFYLDDRGLELGPSFSVLHSVAHMLGAGPAYRFSVRRKFGLRGEETKVKKGVTTGALISVAGIVAIGAHGLLLLMAICACCLELLFQKQLRRQRSEDPTAADVKHLPYRAVQVSRRWLETLFGRSRNSFHVPGDSEVRLFVAIKGADVANVELLGERDAIETMRARGQATDISVMTLLRDCYGWQSR